MTQWKNEFSAPRYFSLRLNLVSMLEIYHEDNISYLYLNRLLTVYETYTINPLDISWLIHIDLDPEGLLFGIEIIPASYIANVLLLDTVYLHYDRMRDSILIQFSQDEADSVVINQGDYYLPPHSFNGNLEIWFSAGKIVFLRIMHASLFLSPEILSHHELSVKHLP